MRRRSCGGIREPTRHQWGFVDNFVNMVEDQWAEEEKEQILDATVQVLEEQGKTIIIKSEGIIGFETIAWIAVATRKNKTAP